MKLSISILLVSFLFGCASAPSYKDFWKKKGFSYEDAVSIEAECRYDAITRKIEGRPTNPKVETATELHLEKDTRELVEVCMLKQGFRMGKYKFER